MSPATCYSSSARGTIEAFPEAVLNFNLVFETAGRSVGYAIIPVSRIDCERTRGP
ncbi:hypothetical protein PM8797T_14404 [Gimesia maris DSM 8797]|nr:hypothetical protein PM8797T_14404 [Gimesia maris DSM 8797]